MATDLSNNPTGQIGEINKFDFPHRNHRPCSRPARAWTAEIVRPDLGDEGRAGVDARLPAAVSLQVFESKPMHRTGAETFQPGLPGHLLLSQADQTSRAAAGTTCRTRSRTPSIEAGHSRGRAEVSWLASRRSSRARLSMGRWRRIWPGPGRDLSRTPTPPSGSISRPASRVLRQPSIPPEDNKFAALNSAVWSGGSFIYVPKGVKIDFPLQAYFRINAEQHGPV